jgi:DNA-binding transcriptional MerR regulator
MIMSSQLARQLPDAGTTIPDRLYFRIGDVARLCGVETHVLRFWETQFPQLKPNKSGTGQRLYRRRDVELALEIKRLVHESGYTLAGARQALDQARQRREPTLKPHGSAVEKPQPAVVSKSQDESGAALRKVRAELREIATLLAVPVQVVEPVQTARPVTPRRRTRIAPGEPPMQMLFE